MLLLLILALTGSIASVYSNTDKIVCYHGNWAAYRNGNGKYTVSNIDPNSCTHIIYAFVGLNYDNTIKVLDSWQSVDLAGFANFNNLRTRNSKLKTLIAIGGWNEGSSTYSAMVSSAAKRATFIQSAISFIQTYGFDGFDLDWEYPAQRGGASTDKANFALLLQEMRAEFNKYGYLLTAAVAAAAASVDLSYDVPALSKYLDFINVMTYDLHGSWDGVTGHNAPLYPSSFDVTAAQRSLNVDSCISGWIARGASPDKIIMGVGTYGRTFTLQSTANTNIGAPTTGAGTGGQYTGESGFLGYNEVCENVLNGWTVVWDDEQKVPYAYKGNQWVGYDNPQSIAIKVAYAKARGLGGIMVWSLETDDFHGKCGSVNPILSQIKTSMGLPPGTIEPPTTGTGPETGNGSNSGSSSTSSTTSAPTAGVGATCTTTGYMRDPSNCSVFYYCQASANGYSMFSFTCSNGLYYDLNLGVCNWAANVDC
nr:chitinase-3-like protein 1 [Onthophagus taurus]